ncbi:MAG: hypothetical protein LW832_10725 [Parachlamydia sp.]|jgi:hypothetical protein|nr:hypothetical protein [Parachlamydia sp.]
MSPIIKKINLALGLLWTLSTSYSYADMDATTCLENSYCYPCKPPRGHGFIGAEVLYWRAFEDGLDVCIPTDFCDNLLSDGRIISTFEGKGKDPKFEWNPGFRIGTGYAFACTNWEVGALWTHYNSKAHRTLCDCNRFKWNIDLDVIDLLVAYQSDLNSCFSLKPYLGIRVARIDQKLRMGEAPDSRTFAKAGKSLFGSDNKHEFTGVGPLFGLEVDFQVACGFSLYANGAVSWFYGNHDVRLTNSIATVDVIDYSNIKNKTSSTLMAADASLGIRWQTCFCSKQFFVQLGYEHHRYFDYSRIGKCGDLSFDGLNFGLGIGF